MIKSLSKKYKILIFLLFQKNKIINPVIRRESTNISVCKFQCSTYVHCISSRFYNLVISTVLSRMSWHFNLFVTSGSLLSFKNNLAMLSKSRPFVSGTYPITKNTPRMQRIAYNQNVAAVDIACNKKTQQPFHC